MYLLRLSNCWYFLQKCELGRRLSLDDGNIAYLVVRSISGQTLREDLGKSLKFRHHFKVAV